jgi:hypothetical protein
MDFDDGVADQSISACDEAVAVLSEGGLIKDHTVIATSGQDNKKVLSDMQELVKK